MKREKILVWLPSPIGDAVLCTPALRAIRNRFESAHIYFLANKTVGGLLSPNNFNDQWIQSDDKNVFTLTRQLRGLQISTAILFKNSFGSAISVFLGGISRRVGYARDGRSIFLTDKLQPLKDPDGSFKPISMIDYYLTIAEHLGCSSQDRRLELLVNEKDEVSLSKKLSDISLHGSPLIILVPGGAFGLSKCWPSERFAQTADWLIAKYNAAVIVAVAPNQAEQQIANQICEYSREKLYSLVQTPLTMGELKALFARVDLVIANDTGPRHIATAFGRRIISLFGPNNPAWTETNYKDEVQIIGKAHCVPCEKPQCKEEKHICMESISVEQVCSAAQNILDKPEDN